MNDNWADLWWLNASLPDTPLQEPQLPSVFATYDPVWCVYSDGVTAEAAYRAEQELHPR